MNILRRVSGTDWLAIVLLVLYVALLSTLTIRQHHAFNTRALDLAKFDQSIWNTSRGRPYQITIGEDLVIESHFSPSLALFAPLYWVWPDIRILFVAQSLLLGGAGFLIYWHFRRTVPWLGIALFVAYLMHPLLHQVNLLEFRRVTLAVFAISFALYHLVRRQYGWMALGLALALLSKEDMSLLVISFGIYIMLGQRSYLAGAVTALTGLAWFIFVPFFLLPRLMVHDQHAGYQHAASSFGYLGETLPQIVRTLLERPLIMWEYIGRAERLRALLGLLWPAGFFFLLAPATALLGVPYLALLMASTSDTMGTLGGWYPGVLVVILYWAAGLGIARLSARWRMAAIGTLLVAGVVAWISGSEVWPGSRYDAARFTVSDHHEAVRRALRDIPQEAIVMAQDPLVPHLSHREDIYLLPWLRGGNRPDYVLFDRQMGTYPVPLEAYRTLFYDYLAGDEYAIARQIDSFYLFEHVGEAAPRHEASVSFDGLLLLRGLSVDSARPGEEYLPEMRELPPGSNLRVMLFWQVLEETDRNLTAFVHAVGPDGRLLAQHDSWPADAHRPTSVLRRGEKVRDVHYLALNETAALPELTLRIGLYQSDTGEPVPTREGQPFIEVPLR